MHFFLQTWWVRFILVSNNCATGPLRMAPDRRAPNLAHPTKLFAISCAMVRTHEQTPLVKFAFFFRICFRIFFHIFLVFYNEFAISVNLESPANIAISFAFWVGCPVKIQVQAQHLAQSQHLLCFRSNKNTTTRRKINPDSNSQILLHILHIIVITAYFFVFFLHDFFNRIFFQRLFHIVLQNSKKTLHGLWLGLGVSIVYKAFNACFKWDVKLVYLASPKNVPCETEPIQRFLRETSWDKSVFSVFGVFGYQLWCGKTYDEDPFEGLASLAGSKVLSLACLELGFLADGEDMAGFPCAINCEGGTS